MASNFKKISICATIFTFISVLGHRPLWALTTPLAKTHNSQDVDTLNVGEVTDTKNELLLLAKRNIQERIPASESNVVISNATRSYYIAKQPASRQQTYTFSYRNIWTQQNNLPRQRKVPEPSAIVGLIAMVSWLRTQLWCSQ